MKLFLSDLLKEESESRVNFYNDFINHSELENKMDADILLTCIDYCLVREHYKLRTSQKKWLVKEIEKLDAESFGLALAKSHTVADRRKIILNFLSYNKFSRNQEHRVIVKDLRNGSLTTANRLLKQKVRIRDLDGVKRIVGAVPSLFWEKLSEITKYFSQEELKEIGEYCHFSIDSLVKSLTKENNPVVHEILKETLAQLDLGIKGKRVKVDAGDISPEFSFWKEAVANKVPATIKNIRIKLQWKDEVSNSIDLITTKEDSGHITILGHGEKREEFLSSKDNCGIKCSEWVDLDLTKIKGKFNFHAHLYSGRNLFSQVGECTIRLEEIDNLGGESLRQLKSWRVRNNSGFVDLGTLNINHRVFSYHGKSIKYSIPKILTEQEELNYSLQDLVNDVIEQQNLKVVKDREDFILSLSGVAPKIDIDFSK